MILGSKISQQLVIYRNDLEWMKYQGFKNREKAAYIKELLHTKSFSEGKNLAVVHTLDERLIGDIYLKNEADFFLDRLHDPSLMKSPKRIWLRSDSSDDTVAV